MTQTTISLEEQATLVETSGLSTLFFCPDAWALRHRFINQETGETIRARCGSWSCLYCGPRKVDMWRQLVKAAEPTLFVTLTKVGRTLEESSRVLTTVVQYLRRGSHGRGKNHIGARPAYPIEVFSVIEEHTDFEENGFHWHLLIKGVDFLPNQVVSDALRSATKGRSYITKVKRIKNNRAVGYVTKYLTKEVMREHRGMVLERRFVKQVPVLDKQADGSTTVRVDESGNVIEEQEEQLVERLCRAHRIRYSKHFFPTSTKEMRRQLFGEKELTETQAEQAIASEQETVTSELDQEQEQEAGQEDESQEEAVQEVDPSPWVLFEAMPFSDEISVYRQRRRDAVRESLSEFREGKRFYSRRVISIWGYQRSQFRLVS